MKLNPKKQIISEHAPAFLKRDALNQGFSPLNAGYRSPKGKKSTHTGSLDDEYTSSADTKPKPSQSSNSQQPRRKNSLRSLEDGRGQLSNRVQEIIREKDNKLSYPAARSIAFQESYTLKNGKRVQGSSISSGSWSTELKAARTNNIASPGSDSDSRTIAFA